MSSTPPFASQSQPFFFDNAQPDLNNSQTMGHVAPLAPALIRCQCGWSVFSSSLSHDDHCAFTNLSPHCITMAASIVAGSHKRKGAATSTQQSNPQRDFCSDFAAQHPQRPLLTEHMPLVDVLRIACCGPYAEYQQRFIGQYVIPKLDSRGRPRKKAGQTSCYLSAADSNKHSHAMRDAFALIAQWAKDQPDIKAKTDLLNLPAAAGESALGGLRVLCAAGFPSTLLQHVVRFTLQRLRSFTVEWCGGLVKQHRLEPVDEPTLCSCLADLINANAYTLKLQPGELELLAQALRLDGIFVQPHDNNRSNDLRRFIIDTLNLNRTMDFQRNFIECSQLFQSAPSTPTSPSVAPMEEHWSAPPSPSNSSDSSGESRATAPSRVLASPFPPHDEVYSSDDSNDEHFHARKRLRIDDSPGLVDDSSPASKHPGCTDDLSDENGAAPPSSTPPSSAPVAEPTDFELFSVLVESFSFPGPSPSTPQ